MERHDIITLLLHPAGSVNGSMLVHNSLTLYPLPNFFFISDVVQLNLSLYPVPSTNALPSIDKSASVVSINEWNSLFISLNNCILPWYESGRCACILVLVPVFRVCIQLSNYLEINHHSHWTNRIRSLCHPSELIRWIISALERVRWIVPLVMLFSGRALSTLKSSIAAFFPVISIFYYVNFIIIYHKMCF